MADGEALAYVPEVEPGNEMQFCPIRQQPIIRSQRVRALPGLHLLSLGAGREALARGHYDAFGQRFACSDLEYLHVDDKVFICAEDHKAFKNQMSMQYHRYIRFELEERKAERKRLRERAAERQARSAAHAARQQQQQPPAAPATATAAAAPARTSTVASAAAAPSSKGAVGAEAAGQPLAINDPYLGEGSGGAAKATDDPYSVPNDPEPPTAASTAATSAAAPLAAAAAPPAAAASAAAVPAAAAPKVTVRKPVPPDEEDLYDDVGGPEVKRPKQASTYANAIGAMMTDDFDEDE